MVISLLFQWFIYSPLSKDYMSLNLIYSIVNTFGLLDRISDLDISGLFNILKTNYKGDFDCYGFLACANIFQNSLIRMMDFLSIYLN